MSGDKNIVLQSRIICGFFYLWYQVIVKTQWQ